jgi:hypothetical protein
MVPDRRPQTAQGGISPLCYKQLLMWLLQAFLPHHRPTWDYLAGQTIEDFLARMPTPETSPDQTTTRAYEFLVNLRAQLRVVKGDIHPQRMFILDTLEYEMRLCPRPEEDIGVSMHPEGRTVDRHHIPRLPYRWDGGRLRQVDYQDLLIWLMQTLLPPAPVTDTMDAWRVVAAASGHMPQLGGISCPALRRAAVLLMNLEARLRLVPANEVENHAYVRCGLRGELAAVQQAAQATPPVNGPPAPDNGQFEAMLIRYGW